jgi:hypothetical protein
MYEPKPFMGSDLASLAMYVQDELQSIARSQSDTLDAVQLNTLNREPARPREGLICKADGTNWDPGSGAGIYEYTNSAWALLSE